MLYENQVVNEQEITCRFLLRNSGAGTIIGKSGSNIAEIQVQSSTKMQLSRANEFFPGTYNELLHETKKMILVPFSFLRTIWLVIINPWLFLRCIHAIPYVKYSLDVTHSVKIVRKQFSLTAFTLQEQMSA